MYLQLFFFFVNLKGKFLNNNDVIIYKLTKFTSKKRNSYVSSEDLKYLKIDIELLDNRLILEHFNALGYIKYDFDFLSSSETFSHLTVDTSALDYVRDKITISFRWHITTFIALLALILSVVSIAIHFFY